jgi:membrane protein implicated in regulation of membrane protease activity
MAGRAGARHDPHMATLDLDRRRTTAPSDLARSAFWVLCLGFLACYAFFAALGAFSPGEVIGLTLAAVVVLGLWLVHAAVERRQQHDPRARNLRERRGF